MRIKLDQARKSLLFCRQLILEKSESEMWNETEAMVFAAWHRVLGIAPERNDNFFSLGGDSLAAIRCSSELTEQLGFKIPLRILFQSGSLADYLAEIHSIQSHTRDSAHSSCEFIDPSGGPALTISQERRLRWMSEQYAQSGMVPPSDVIPIIIRISANVTDDEIAIALSKVIDRHEALRTGFLKGPNGYGICVAERGVSFNLERRHVASAEAGSACVQEVLRTLINTRFALDRPPLLRAVICRQGAAQATLVIAVDHFVFDGESQNVFVRDFARFIREPDIVLPEPLQMGAFAAWQRNRLSGEHRASLLQYWRRTLAGTDPLPELHLPKPALPQAANSGVGKFSLSGDAPQRLRDNSALLNVTPFIVYLTAIASALARIHGLRDMVIYGPASNRELPGTFDMVGYISHSVLYRIQLDGSEDWPDRISTVKQIVLDAIANRIPLAILDDALHAAQKPYVVMKPRLFLHISDERQVEEEVRDGIVSKVPHQQHVSTLDDSGLLFDITDNTSHTEVRLISNSNLVDGGFLSRLAHAIKGELEEFLGSSQFEGRARSAVSCAEGSGTAAPAGSSPRPWPSA